MMGWASYRACTLNNLCEAAGMRTNNLRPRKLSNASDDSFDKRTFTTTKMKVAWFGVAARAPNDNGGVHSRN